jgi:NTP pyrophosphatase (non-canonical NTP hydrolase)
MSDSIDVNELKTLLQQFADARDWNQFHTPKNLSMALAGESGELLEIFQWMSDSESLSAKSDAAIREKTAHELADIMLYLVRLAGLMNINLSKAIKEKLILNSQKYPADLVKGSARKSGK